MSHIGTGNGEAIVSTVATVGFHGRQGFGKEICAAVKIGDKMGNGRKERGFADKKGC